jgi:ornithine carbamoyltransferase
MKKQTHERPKDLLGLEYLNREQIEEILTQTLPMKQLFTRSVKKAPALRGRTVALVFFEPSTRTRTSFELAAKRLSADVLNVSSSTSSVQKGESLIDTAKTLEAMKADFIILRHSASGAPHLISREIKTHVLNAGDGSHEHPTQGLLDIFTILEKKKRIDGLKIAILGDIAHSRVALRGSELHVFDGVELRPEDGRPLRPGVTVAAFAKCIGTRCSYLMADQHYREAITEHLETHNLVYAAAPMQPADTYVRTRMLLREGRVKIHALEFRDRMVQQMREVQGKPTSGGGMSIVHPRWAKGGHGDLVAALVLALWQVSGDTVPTPEADYGSKRWEMEQKESRRKALEDKQNAAWWSTAKAGDRGTSAWWKR